MLTGLLPENDPRPPSAISQCDPRFDAVVRKATHPSPRQRYQDAAQIAGELEKIASSAGPRALRTTSPAISRRPAARAYSMPSTKKGGGGLVGALLALAGLVALFVFKDRVFQQTHSSPDPVPVVDQTPKPVDPGLVAPDPEPADPEPGLVASDPNPAEPEPGLVASDPNPAEPEPGLVASAPNPAEPEPGLAASDPESAEPEHGQVASDPGPVEPEPKLVASNPGTEPWDPPNVTSPQPKFDVEGFLAHARSVMAGHCGPEIVKRDEALRKNLRDFNSDAKKSMRENLAEMYQAAGQRELGEFIDQLEENGNRMGEGLEKPLKFKKWLVAIHDTYKEKEADIDREMMNAFAEQEKTYVYGLGLKVKALQEEDDPAAADLIKAEIEKVGASPDYFAGLMLEACKH